MACFKTILTHSTQYCEEYIEELVLRWSDMVTNGLQRNVHSAGLGFI